MAKETPVETGTDDVQWERLPGSGLGTEWDFERDGPMIGHFIGTETVETQKTESGHATALQFAPIDAPDDVVFVWESAALESISNGELVRVGDLVRITYLGREQFTGGDGKPRQIKRYRVEAAKR